jgi:predicted small metal-binding protein
MEETKMGCGRMKVACEDGFEVVTKDQKELVALTQWHVENAHHKKVTEHEVMAMSKHP